jgi:hypothetical protein
MPEPSRGTLLPQLERASVLIDEDWPTFIGLVIGSRTGPVTDDVRLPLESEATVIDDAGEPSGGILLWLDDHGFLSAIEYFWYTDERPTEFPRPDLVLPLFRSRDETALPTQ